MGDDGEVATFQGRQGEDTTYGRQFLTGEATYDTGLTEEGLYRRVRRGDRPCMA